MGNLADPPCISDAITGCIEERLSEDMENHSFSTHGKNFIKSLGTGMVSNGVVGLINGSMDEFDTNKDTKKLKKGIRNHMKDDFTNLINRV